MCKCDISLCWMCVSVRSKKNACEEMDAKKYTNVTDREWMLKHTLKDVSAVTTDVTLVLCPKCNDGNQADITKGDKSKISKAVTAATTDVLGKVTVVHMNSTLFKWNKTRFAPVQSESEYDTQTDATDDETEYESETDAGTDNEAKCVSEPTTTSA